MSANGGGSPQEPPNAPERRINVIAIRDKLLKSLGQTGGKSEASPSEQYWTVMKLFAACKLTKDELDKSTRELFRNEETVALHNQLVRAILHNAIHCSSTPGAPNEVRQPHPTIAASSSLKPASLGGYGQGSGQPKKKQRIEPKFPNSKVSADRDFQDIPVRERVDKLSLGSKLHSSARHLDGTPRVNYAAERLDVSAGALRPVKSEVLYAGDPAYFTTQPDHQVYDVEDLDFCDASWTMVSTDTLKNRMFQTCIECGIGSLSDDAVAMLERGLELHLNTILRKCISLTRPRRLSATAALATQVDDDSLQSLDGLDSLVTTFDLGAAAELYPNTLGEDRSRLREMVESIQY